MSNTDSFVDEVSEELRRDRLYAMLRRYGWIAVLAVLLLVGGAAYREWTAAQDRAKAQALGDALSDALRHDDSAKRAEALAGIEGGAALGGLLLAAEQLESGDGAAALASLGAVAADPEVAPIYQELARFKAALIPDQPAEDRSAALEALAVPGGSYRLLAMEQRALMALDSGDAEAALRDLRAIDEDAEATSPLRERVRSLMVALGADQPAAGTSEQTQAPAETGTASQGEAQNEG